MSYFTKRKRRTTRRRRARKTLCGYRWVAWKIYKNEKAAERQGRAIYASGYRNGKKKRPKTKKSRR